MDTEVEGRKRATTNGELVLQWGSRKRSRGAKVENNIEANNVPGVLKKSIRVDRRVVRAEKQAYRARKQSQRGLPSAPELHGLVHKSVKRLTNIPPTTACSNQIKQNSCEPVEFNAAQTGEKDLTLPDKPDKDAFGATRANETLTSENHLQDCISTRDTQGETQNMELSMLPKFMIALSRSELEEDFMAIKGTKLPQRPKRRAKHVQRSLQCVSPGSWLCELSLDRYEVREKKSIRKPGCVKA